MHLQTIFNEIKAINQRLAEMEKLLARQPYAKPEISESALLRLPDHLRKTYLIIVSRGECTATDVSLLTGRARAIESCYLNQLTRSGWLNKWRDGKEVIFRPL